MSGRRGGTEGRGPRPATSTPLARFEVYVRVGAGADALSMRVPDVHAVDGADALRQARAIYGHLAVVRGIGATRA